MAIEIDPADLIVPKRYGDQGIPHDAWTKLRRDAPVYRCEPEGYAPFYAITRHADIMDISNKPQIFSNIEGPILGGAPLLRLAESERRSERPHFAPAESSQ